MNANAALDRPYESATGRQSGYVRPPPGFTRPPPGFSPRGRGSLHPLPQGPKTACPYFGPDSKPPGSSGFERRGNRNSTSGVTSLLTRPSLPSKYRLTPMEPSRSHFRDSGPSSYSNEPFRPRQVPRNQCHPNLSRGGTCGFAPGPVYQSYEESHYSSPKFPFRVSRLNNGPRTGAYRNY